MYTDGNLATVDPTELFALPDVDISSEFSREDLDSDMDGLALRFPRVKIPTGGALYFEMPTDDPENPEPAKSLTGVILFHHANNSYWAGGPDDEDKTPLCSSVDGKLGIGDPGGLCASCSLNQFGSGKDGKGKGCKNMRDLYILQSGQLLPLVLSLSPTSLRPFSEFMNAAFLTRHRASYGSVVQIGLKKKNNGKDDYSVATFHRLYDFAGEQLAQIKAYTSSFREQIHTVLEERVAMNEERSGDGCEHEDFQVKHSAPGGAFVVGQGISGERDALPD